MTRSRDLANLGDITSTLENQGLTLISTTTFSAVASQSINDVFSATYDNYFIQGNFTPASGQEIYYRLRVAGADATGSNYANQQFKGTSSTSIADAETVRESALAKLAALGLTEEELQTLSV
jgi:hypothetical protein